MTHQKRVTVCSIRDDDTTELFHKWFGSIVESALSRDIELRLGFPDSSHSLYYCLGLTCPSDVTPERGKIAGGVDRYHWNANGLTIRAWHGPSESEIRRLLYHDVPLETEYVVQLAPTFVMDKAAWNAMWSMLDGKADYLGKPCWKAYSLMEMEAIRKQPWHTGVPFEQRDGQPGVAYIGKGLVAVHCERLRGVAYPSGRREDDEWLLGEIARQLGWTRAEFIVEPEA